MLIVCELTKVAKCWTCSCNWKRNARPTTKNCFLYNHAIARVTKLLQCASDAKDYIIWPGKKACGHWFCSNN